MAAAVNGRDRETVFVHHFEVSLDGLLGHLRNFLDRLALGGDTGQLGNEDAEAPFGLRLQDDLILGSMLMC
ncbi:MAG TPA: hypothetical protein VNO20_11645 [Solirubrobacterales bacterium]|nr:hypothetical protein [Solirubrobacterales bacterium]